MQNPGTFPKGNIPWNKGLSKTDPRVAQYGASGSKTKLILSSQGLLPTSWNKGLTKNTDFRLKNLSKILTGIKRKPESIEKSRINAGKKIREQYQNGERKWWGLDPKNKKIWERVQQRFGDETVRQKARLAMGRSKQNKLEKYFEKILQENLPNKYEFTGNGKMIIKGKFPDFTNIAGQKKVILINGIYWHTKFVKRENLKRSTIEVLESYPYNVAGYQVLHVWEDELANFTKGGKYIFHEDITGVLTKIKQFDIL